MDVGAMGSIRHGASVLFGTHGYRVYPGLVPAASKVNVDRHGAAIAGWGDGGWGSQVHDVFAFARPSWCWGLCLLPRGGLGARMG